jgi:TusA-related sulfurtransferase
MLCPRPVIELARRLDSVPVGSILGVVSDDTAAAHDIPAWCRMRGHEYVGADTADDGVARYLVRRTDAG